MIIPDDVVCKTCERVFCCSECREKHEIKIHAIGVHCVDPVLHLFCPICQKKPLILQAAIHADLLAHITKYHLPLNCQKCSRIYTKVQDLMEFSKCTQHVACKLEVSNITSSHINEESASTPPMQSHAFSVSTQTSPIYVPQINDSHLTPISMINLRWKSKSKANGEFISDSVSSIKNISSIDGSTQRKGIGVGIPITRGKIVRSTSTPLQGDLLNKPKEQVFNVSGAHVSSIYSSVSEPESSPPLVLPIGSTPSNRQADLVNRYHKVRGRGKISAAATPLRQVMSKSIQKAIEEHGMTNGSRVVGGNPKKMFDSVDSSSDVSEKSSDCFCLPLDLRLSPALRRTQSEIIDRKRHIESESIFENPPINTLRGEFAQPITRKGTESIIITSKLDTDSEILLRGTQVASSVYQTCHSVEIITSTSTQLNKINFQERDVVIATSTEVDKLNLKNEGAVIVKTISQPIMPTFVPITPRIPIPEVQISKKLIKFETPVVSQKVNEDKDNLEEKFYTPNSSPVRSSETKQDNCAENLSRKFYSLEEQDYSDKMESFGSNYTDVDFENEDFIDDKKLEQNKSKLWSIVSSVIRLPSLNRVTENTNSKSLIKRCASFAGSLVNKGSENNDQPMKRKRTYTIDSQSFDFSKGNNTDCDITCSNSKRFRIQARKPINRMRYYEN